jgi:hypothetical protein
VTHGHAGFTELTWLAFAHSMTRGEPSTIFGGARKSDRATNIRRPRGRRPAAQSPATSVAADRHRNLQTDRIVDIPLPLQYWRSYVAFHF